MYSKKILSALTASILAAASCNIAVYAEETESVSEEESTEDLTTFDGIVTAIDNDTAEAISSLSSSLDVLYKTVGDTFDSYAANSQIVADWYQEIADTSETLYSSIDEKVDAYYQLMVSSTDSDHTDTLSDYLDDLYDAVYDDAFDDYYDNIYDDAFDDIYDYYYDGVFDDAYDTVDYEEWNDARSDFYDNWVDARSDFYDDWTDARSDFYKIWSRVSRKIYSGDLDDIEHILEKD